MVIKNKQKLYLCRPSLVPSAEDDSAVPEDKKPCFICSFFKDSFDDVQDHINTVKDRENEIDFDPNDDGLDINNSTHTRKVKRIIQNIYNCNLPSGVGGWFSGSHQQNCHCRH